MEKARGSKTVPAHLQVCKIGSLVPDGGIGRKRLPWPDITAQHKGERSYRLCEVDTECDALHP